MIFVSSFYALCVCCSLLYLYTRSAAPSSDDAAFRRFQHRYLVVYLLAMAADWLQGPYVYALYEHYGMTSHQIEQLFVAGFGSSMIVGTVVGSFADKYGRRANCILYGILYALACVTKHFNNFHILMIGRLLGGTATSILYSAFESWVVYEHHARAFDKDLLGTIFSHATLGNSIVAIAAGVVAQFVAIRFGFVSPFDVSMFVLIAMVILVMMVWSENYGDSKASLGTSFKTALYYIKADRKVLCLGLIQSLFEGAMYTFVLEWTPALSQSQVQTDPGRPKEVIPHGFIFAAFMVAIMIGSSGFKIAGRYLTVESFMRPVLLVSALALCVPVIMPSSQSAIFIGFLVFECCVGIFWPSLGTMRGRYVPEEARSTIMNFFRIPLNLIVIFILLQNLVCRWSPQWWTSRRAYPRLRVPPDRHRRGPSGMGSVSLMISPKSSMCDEQLDTRNWSLC
ncbi:molybdate-anion transporter-like isoform X2 [Acanthaster planci]|uniref:Molybdate-anion transporter-like isoform X2 n=1 Tax=Acanthaster planci TaxID=133434 RepID=A0A8B7ZGF8_ACAPL|nr:molybdate-anion transporter-like isoform X2 [Acanthaster planci]